MSKRPFSITTGEVSAFFWGLGLIFTMMSLWFIFRVIGDLSLVYPGVAAWLSFAIFFIIISLFMTFIGMFLPNYQISKNNLNLFIDRITNPDWLGWIRQTRNNRLRIHMVNTGPLGQTKGMANGAKADVFNDGKSTLTTSNGNQCILTSDFLSTNIDLRNAIGWNLLYKHYGIIGFDAWEHAAENDQLLFPLQKKEVEDGKRGNKREEV